MNQLGHKLFASTTRVTPMRHASEPDKIACERRGRPRDHCSALAQTCGRVDEGVWHAYRRWAAPRPAGGVEKLLYRDGLLVAYVINTMNAGFDDRSLGRAQKIRSRQQLKQCRLFPHAEQPPASKPMGGFDHQNAPAVNHSQSEHDWGRR